MLGIGCVRLDDDGLLEMVARFYHPSLPMLRILPSAASENLFGNDPASISAWIVKLGLEPPSDQNKSSIPACAACSCTRQRLQSLLVGGGRSH
jgi:hypothetical protein